MKILGLNEWLVRGQWDLYGVGEMGVGSQPEPPTLLRTSVTPAFSNFLGNALKVLIPPKPHGMGDPQVVLHIPAQTGVKRLNPQEAAFIFKFLSEY